MKNNKLEIKFNKNLYQKKALVLAIEAFGHLAEFDIKSKGVYFIIEISPKQEMDKEALIKEFANYCLYSMKNF